jgi:hypothetical protein
MLVKLERFRSKSLEVDFSDETMESFLGSFISRRTDDLSQPNIIG